MFFAPCFERKIDPALLLKNTACNINIGTLEKKAGVLDEELSTIQPDRLDRPREEKESGKEPC